MNPDELSKVKAVMWEKKKIILCSAIFVITDVLLRREAFRDVFRGKMSTERCSFTGLDLFLRLRTILSRKNRFTTFTRGREFCLSEDGV